MKKYFNVDSMDYKDAVKLENITFPVFNRYAFSNLNEFVKTRIVNNGRETDELKYGKPVDLRTVQVKDFDNNKMSMKDYLKKVNTDGFLVLKDNEIIVEEYFDYQSEMSKHIMFSVTKSLTGILLAKAIYEGYLSYDDKVSDILPELKDPGFKNVTVRNILDMQLILDFSEDYSDPKADIWYYSIAFGLMPEPKDYNGPKHAKEALVDLKIKSDERNFLYTTPISDLCNWVLTRIKNKPLSEIFQEEIFSKIGAERESLYSIDSFGTEMASGGFMVTLRDAARIAKLMLNKGMYNGEEILPKEIFEEFENMDNKEEYRKRYQTSLQAKQPGKKEWFYKNQIWFMNSEDEDYSFIGVYGQILYVNPKKNIVVIKQGSNKVASEPMLGYQNAMIQQFIDQL